MGVVVFMFGFLSFVSRWSHLLSVLLSLELMAVGIFIVLFGLVGYNGGGGWVGLVYLAFVVCEGGLGLGLIVSLVRCHGGDCLMSFIGDVGGSF
uniref:NADH dehydrogenase subunit 4L n=1 Tax=Charinus carajas TaxID=3045142 RepID=UPI00257D09E5|nr:NADH dehydrogenase subunit 4L [Charinus carajas]WGV34170.1 NADH dehydrogenase subunit 4L [Charinus carajas]WGV34183.1 NADH dehydrogenase subunit 4L [Charinus carajas]WGV34196.1 NADH dehydrogenase subunit 4L [Charinus carajas]